jgi:DNA-directed RNA polymerase I subunit RPA2
VSRGSFQKIAPHYTPYASMIRCTKRDQSSQTITVHYLNNGHINVRFILGKSEFFLPVVILLKSFVETTDREIYEKILCGGSCKVGPDGQPPPYLGDAIEVLLREQEIIFTGKQLYTQSDFLSYVGSRFRVVLQQSSSRLSDSQVGTLLLERYVFVHLSSNVDKFHLLIFMIQKLFALVHGEIGIDGTDSPITQEVLLPGHLYLRYLKEKLREYLYSIRTTMQQDANIKRSMNNNNNTSTKSSSSSSTAEGIGQFALWRKAMEKIADVGQKMQYFLSTGNMSADASLDLQQMSGYCIVAERLNFLRFLSHFRSAHRGAFFATMKTTSVRKLLPDSWGFFCPVHTPDGAPCGLLNHLTRTCKVVCDLQDQMAAQRSVLKVCSGAGMLPLAQLGMESSSYLVVMLDGRLLGKVPAHKVEKMTAALRFCKVWGKEGVPPNIEIAVVPPHSTEVSEGRSFEIGIGPRYPGVFLFSSPARMMRPTYNLKVAQPPSNTITSSSQSVNTEISSLPPPVEYIGTFEQCYMNIACSREDLQGVEKGVYSHLEISKEGILSVVADLIPFPDFNQSPRNMYQCQMGKQTMGTPIHAYPHRKDNKLFRLQTPQAPIVCTRTNEAYSVNEYPTGTNAVVAVISYTGYDMEDAMIVNKSAFERGFAHAQTYKTEVIELVEKTSRKGQQKKKFFNNWSEKEKQVVNKYLDEDGLPSAGQKLNQNDPFYSYYDSVTNEHKVVRYKSMEECIVDNVKVIADDSSNLPQIANITLRYDRNPVIGDKFSSRHGQKGVLSQLWPQVDMPFSESGMTPDVIINPHAFPSRMTIGMLVESLAGKAGALHGIFQDSTPFQFDEQNTAVDYFSQMLVKAGYNYYGSEVMYSGIMGTQLVADIYFGVVYYQRLRHMVKDKYQVRATGPINSLTRQPVKGRKNRGGIRFGEMERDSLLAHGVSFLLHDRLMNCSDASKSYLCNGCGNILTPTVRIGTYKGYSTVDDVYCRFCQNGKHIEVVHIPYVFKYLAAELAACGMNVMLFVK